MEEYYNLFEENHMKKAYENTYRQVYNYFYYLTLSREWAEDLTSKTYLRVLEKRALYNPEKAGILTWILAIARNIWVDEYRIAGKEKWMNIEEVEESAFASNSAELDKSENRILIESLLLALTKKERMIVVLKYEMDFTYQKIAENMGISEKNVSVILSRSMKKMLAKLNKK